MVAVENQIAQIKVLSGILELIYDISWFKLESAPEKAICGYSTAAYWINQGASTRCYIIERYFANIRQCT